MPGWDHTRLIYSKKDLHLRRTEWHKEFEGNSCRTLLRHTDELQAIVHSHFDALLADLSSWEHAVDPSEEAYHQRNYAESLDFVNAFKTFNEVVHTCFGARILPRWRGNILAFGDAYRKLRIPITTKAHIVIHHLQAFLTETGQGLTVFSEQAFEAVHADFDTFWSRHKVLVSSNPNYWTRLMKTVTEYNADHMGSDEQQ